MKFIWSTIGQPHEHPNEIPYENPIEHPFEYSINSVPIWTMMPISLFGAFRSSRNFGESSKIRFSSKSLAKRELEDGDGKACEMGDDKETLRFIQLY